MRRHKRGKAYTFPLPRPVEVLHHFFRDFINPQQGIVMKLCFHTICRIVDDFTSDLTTDERRRLLKGQYEVQRKDEGGYIIVFP